MRRRFLLAITLALIAGAAIGWVVATAEAPPPRPEQPHPDQFMFGSQSYAQYNPLDTIIKSTREVRYRLLTMSGCSSGTIPADMVRLEGEAQKLGVGLFRDDFAYDFTVRINCGSEQIRICGGVTIFCLGRGFPYIPDVEISDILSTYQAITRLSILCHEICGHTLATWEEQYCKGIETSGICQGLSLFTPAPGWRDVMNTGPDSRHGLEAIELERWSRTMFNVLEEPVPEWGACELYPDGSWGCWNNYGQFWQRTIWEPATYRWTETDPVWRCYESCP